MGLRSVAERETVALRSVAKRPVTRFAQVMAVPRASRVSLFALACVAVFASATFLRVWQLNALGFNGDEAIYAGQAASIADNADLKPFFPIFRAHPLLFQTVLSFGYRLGGGDLAARLTAVAAGLGTVYLVYAAGRLLYGRNAGLCAALFMALMPYHVVVSRQVLLDGPMVFFATLSLYLLARYATSENRVWLYASGAAIGFTVISKETAILLVPVAYAFFALSPSIRLRMKDVAISMAIMAMVIAPYPLAVFFSGKQSTGQNYLTWQLFRRPNHGLMFYPTTVPEAMGFLVVAAAIAGFWFLRHERSWRETLLVSWIIVPVAFFELWPVKGFQYLLPIAPAVAILAGRMIGRWPVGAPLRFLGLTVRATACVAVAVAVIAVSLVIPSWSGIHPASSDEFLAGSGGVPGGREAGHWIDANVPVGAKLLTLGPSMANILQFYGHRKAYGLSVSPNPLHRNPSYEAIDNPDRELRDQEIQYLVWDSYSASRSSFFSDGLLRYVARYHGRPVHEESVTVRNADGTPESKPVIVIYEVRP